MFSGQARHSPGKVAGGGVWAELVGAGVGMTGVVAGGMLGAGVLGAGVGPSAGGFVVAAAHIGTLGVIGTMSVLGQLTLRFGHFMWK